MGATLPAWPEFLSISTAAAYLDCSEGFVRKLLSAPDPLPSITLGNRARRIPRAALDTYLAKQMAGAPSFDAILAEVRSSRSR
jgi:excisionase family DNA binding protein